MDTRFALSQRYRGPVVEGQHCGHGGYFCGQVAKLAPGLRALTILKPIPLERELTVRISSGRVTVFDRDEEIGNSEVRGAPLVVTIPGPVSLGEAREAGTRFPGFTRRVVPECFGCGDERAPGDGLRVFTGEVRARVNGEKQLAGVWEPDGSSLDGDGFVRPEVVWAVLDCPGGWAIPGQCSTLALQVEILERVPGDRPLIVRGWVQQAIDDKRTSRYAGSALLDEAGRVLALGGAIWVRPRAS